MAAVTKDFTAGSIRRRTSDGEGAIPYRLLSPARIEPDTKYPLVVYLHGAGERGSDNERHLKYLPQWMAEPQWRRKYPCYLVAPQCPQGEWWIDVDWSSAEPAMTEAISGRLDPVTALLDRLLAEHPIDLDRQYLTGISMGGFGAWDLAIRHPERFAAVAPICGGGDPRHVGGLVDVPLWCFHGDRDEVVIPQYSRRMIEALRAAGGTPKYTQLAGVAHDSWTPAYRESELLDWLFSRVRGA